ncbi:hypothetical protein [Actinophytocola sp.]|uniref:hypothetical protein n=1 Tax=Actinophytocola sp. TaxID=1872138 RepID=UPI00389A1DBA
MAHASTRLTAGLTGWNGQLFGDAVAVEFALTNFAVYWFTGTSTSSARFYYENAHTDAATEPTTVPTGLAFFAAAVRSFRRFVDRDHKNVVSWYECATSGHYAAHQAPDVLVADLRGFYGDPLVNRTDT